jgi:hypothetical protein
VHKHSASRAELEYQHDEESEKLVGRKCEVSWPGFPALGDELRTYAVQLTEPEINIIKIACDYIHSHMTMIAPLVQGQGTAVEGMCKDWMTQGLPVAQNLLARLKVLAAGGVDFAAWNFLRAATPGQRETQDIHS